MTGTSHRSLSEVEGDWASATPKCYSLILRSLSLDSPELVEGSKGAKSGLGRLGRGGDGCRDFQSRFHPDIRCEGLGNREPLNPSILRKEASMADLPGSPETAPFFFRTIRLPGLFWLKNVNLTIVIHLRRGFGIKIVFFY
jgi:hypothetical protein